MSYLFLHPAQFGSEVTTYITSKSKGKYMYSTCTEYLFLHPAQKLQHTLQVKAKENTCTVHVQNINFCVRLNPAPKLQHTLQVKPKENENTCKMFNPNPNPNPLKIKTIYLCTFSCLCNESKLYIVKLQKQHTKAFNVWTCLMWLSNPLFETLTTLHWGNLYL